MLLRQPMISCHVSGFATDNTVNEYAQLGVIDDVKGGQETLNNATGK